MYSMPSNKSKAIQVSGTPPLQSYRLKCRSPFSMVGCDYIGPFKLQPVTEDGETDYAGNRTSRNLYVVLYTCLVTRAVCLIPAPCKTAEAFLRTFRELSARYTEPRLIISDNEGAFTASNKILMKIAQENLTKRKFAARGIEWKFLPSRASWMGGVYERIVGLVKTELNKMQGKAKFSEYHWRAHLTEVEAILNDRPLTYVSGNGLEPEVITPKAYLTGTVDVEALGSDINTDQMLMELRRYQNDPVELYKERVKVKEQFWKSLKENYLVLLRHAKYKPTNSRGRYTCKEPKVGQVVSIYDQDMRYKWRKGIIVSLEEDRDGKIRIAMVRTVMPSNNSHG